MYTLHLNSFHPLSTARLLWIEKPKPAEADPQAEVTSEKAKAGEIPLEDVASPEGAAIKASDGTVHKAWEASNGEQEAGEKAIRDEAIDPDDPELASEEPPTEESFLAKLNNVQGPEDLADIAEIIGEFATMAYEMIENGDWRGAADVFHVAFVEQGDPEEAQKESKKSYVATIEKKMLKGDLGFNGLIEVITDPNGADELFPNTPRFRAEAGKAAKDALIKALGITDMDELEVDDGVTTFEFSTGGENYIAELDQSSGDGTLSIKQRMDNGEEVDIPLEQVTISQEEDGTTTVESAPDGDGDPNTLELTGGVPVIEQLEAAFSRLQTRQVPQEPVAPEEEVDKKIK